MTEPASSGAPERRSPLKPAAVYEVGDRRLSIHDLLDQFLDERHESRGISRLADLHLKVGERARYRHDHELVELSGGSLLTPEVVKGLVYPMLHPDHIAQLEEDMPRDVDAAYGYEAKGAHFRLNVFHDKDGLAAVVRHLPPHVPDVYSLGFPYPHVIEDILNLRQGMVIVTGITGSGKSTTIAAMLAALNRKQKMRIITLEDPIEYVMKPDQCLISQREIGRHVGSFAKGLRSALREDPDIIFVGEMRDIETANLALTAAETGHLVFSTLHTRDAKGVVTRMVDLFPAERSKEVMSMMSFSIAYVIAQKLVPRADDSGRLATYEIMKNVPSIANLIRAGNWHQIYSTMQLQAREGMITMEKHLQQLLENGIIDQETALKFANDPTQLRSDDPLLQSV